MIHYLEDTAWHFRNSAYDFQFDLSNMAAGVLSAWVCRLHRLCVYVFGLR